jgi:hypothetical protein
MGRVGNPAPVLTAKTTLALARLGEAVMDAMFVTWGA